jgi:hypothetical protein
MLVHVAARSFATSGGWRIACTPISSPSASARHITQLVLGLPARTRWEELLSGSVINRVLRLNTEMRIHLVPYKKD